MVIEKNMAVILLVLVLASVAAGINYVANTRIEAKLDRVEKKLDANNRAHHVKVVPAPVK